MSAARIPVCDLRAQVAGIRAEIDEGIDRVLSRGWFILGQELEAFETEFARYCGVDHAVGVASGTEALQLILIAIGATDRREVIAPAMTAIPTIAAIASAGATPVLVDVEDATANLDPSLLEAKITPQTAAVVAVHLHGQCADVGAIGEICDRRGLVLVEDAAQAHGASVRERKAGALGRAAAFSFYPTKNLGALGDAGMITTNDRELSERLRRLRNYGQKERDRSIEIGMNSRLDEIQAAILRAKLPHLDGWNTRRRALAARYRDAFQGMPLIWYEDDARNRHVRHLCVIRVEERDRFMGFLDTAAIQTQVHYRLPVHLHPAYAHLGYRPGDFPVAEQYAETAVTLPLFPELNEGSQDRVIDAVREWFHRHG